LTDTSNESAIPVEFSIDHAAISVADLDISMRFYMEILGFTCERIIGIPDGKGRIALLKKADFTIEMFQFNDVRLPLDSERIVINDLSKIGVKHIALRVNDIQVAAEYLKKYGVEFINEPVKGARGFYRFFIKDPDGMPVELTEGPDVN
jgi:catechol 2,3-dioxygenase-like lactoylglutathione lyase family enzyme